VERIGKLKGSATRIGAHKCYQCRKQFTVKVGTVFESSHVPLYMEWAPATRARFVNVIDLVNRLEAAARA